VWSFFRPGGETSVESKRLTEPPSQTESHTVIYPRRRSDAPRGIVGTLVLVLVGSLAGKLIVSSRPDPWFDRLMEALNAFILCVLPIVSEMLYARRAKAGSEPNVALLHALLHSIWICGLGAASCVWLSSIHPLNSEWSAAYVVGFLSFWGILDLLPQWTSHSWAVSGRAWALRRHLLISLALLPKVAFVVPILASLDFVKDFDLDPNVPWMIACGWLLLGPLRW